MQELSYAYIKNLFSDNTLFDNNEYLEYYIKLIVNNVNTQSVRFCTQKHHVFPLHMKKLIPNYFYEDMTVNLSYRDHILAHYYICLFSKNNYILGANYNSIKRVIDNVSSWKSNDDKKEVLRENLTSFLNSLDKYTDIYKKAMLQKAEKNKGKVIIHKDNTTKYIYRNELDYYLNQGWVIGKTPASIEKVRIKKLGKPLSEQARINIANGHRGKPSGMLGKKHSADTIILLKKKHSGPNNAMFGKTHSECIRKQLSEMKKETIDPDIRKAICEEYSLKNYSINKIRLINHMSAKKVMRVLFEEKMIDESFFINKYRV